MTEAVRSRPMRRPLVFALLACLALTVPHAGCKDRRTKEEKLADSEQQLSDKIAQLRKRQEQGAAKIIDLEARLAQVRAKREEIRQRWTEPNEKAAPRPTTSD